MTLAQILGDVYRRCGYSATPASDVSTRITAFIRETQDEIMSEPGMEWLLNDQTSIVSVASQAEYGLPETVELIKSIRDTTNRCKLMPMSLSQYRARFPNPGTDPGTPEYYVVLGQSAVETQPAAAGQLNIISTSASDTALTVYLEGLKTGGIVFAGDGTVTATTNGISQVSIGASDVTSITKFYISGAAVGEIRLRTSTGTILSRIVNGYTAPRYRQIALVPTPSAVITYLLDYERTVSPMTIASDEPVLPVKFHRLLADGARWREYEKQNQLQRLSVARAQYVIGVNNLKYWVYSQAAGSPNLRSYASMRERNSAVNVATS